MPSTIPRRRARALATAVLVLAVSITLLVSHWVHGLDEQRTRREFDIQADKISQAIQNRLKQHVQILAAGAALFHADEEPANRAEWHHLAESLNLQQNYPGIQGLGYTTMLQPEQVPLLEAQIRAEGFPKFAVRPPGPRAQYSAIILLEPLSGRNLAAFGFDMYSEATRRHAMDLAAASGQPSMSGKVKLVQENHGPVQAGFLMYLPVYHPGPERKLQGFVYSPYRMNDLIDGIQREYQLQHEIAFHIYDGTQISPEHLMYADVGRNHDPQAKHSSDLQAQRPIQAFQHQWTLVFHSSPAFEARWTRQTGTVVLSMGLVMSVLLAVLVHSLASREARATELAQRMTEQIKQSEERFQVAVQGSHDGLWDWDLQRQHVYYSPRFLALLGYHSEDWPPTLEALAASMQPSQQSQILADLRQHARSGSLFEVTLQLQQADHTWRWYRLRGQSILNAQGVALRMAGSLSDIADLKAIQADLQQRAALTQAILDNVHDGIITMTPDGIIRSFNRGAERMFGYSAKEIVGQPAAMLMPQTYRSQHPEHVQKYLAEGGQHQHAMGREAEGLTRTGELFPIEAVVTTIEHNGQALIIGRFRDITESRRLDRLKNEFIATVSHELRTPLTSLSGALRLITAGAMGPVPESMHALLTMAEKNSQRLAALINDLLDLEKILAGKMQFDLQIQSLLPLLEQACALNQNYAQHYQVQLKLQTPDTEMHAQVDASRLEQVLTNLISNAVKFSPAGAEVLVRLSQDANHAVIAVQDHGPGIPAEFQAHLFEKFSQADGSDRRQKGGTGLGLAITKELVERMHGHIAFQTSSAGTTFSVSLPLAQRSSEPNPS